MRAPTMRVASAVLGILVLAAPVPAQDGGTLEARRAAPLDDARARYGCPAATAATALPHGAVVTAALGLADIGSGRAVAPGTPLLEASIGKTFVAATVLAPEREGRLARADLLSRHLEDRAWFDDLPNARAITIGPLLYHTSGLPDHVHLPAFPHAWEDLAFGAGAAEPETLVGFVMGPEPLFPVWGHGGWIPGHVSSLRHRADHGVTVAFQINTDVGILYGTSDRVLALEAALADLAIGGAP